MTIRYIQERDDGIIESILRKIGFKKENPKCQAIVEKDSDMVLCGDKVIGTTCSLNYCSQHAPSGAAPGLIRTNQVEFYNIGENEIVKKE